MFKRQQCQGAEVISSSAASSLPLIQSFFSFFFCLRPAITFSMTRVRECLWVGDWPRSMHTAFFLPSGPQSHTSPWVKAQWLLQLPPREGLPHPHPPSGLGCNAAQTESCLQGGAERQCSCLMDQGFSSAKCVYFSVRFFPDKVLVRFFSLNKAPWGLCKSLKPI